MSRVVLGNRTCCGEEDCWKGENFWITGIFGITGIVLGKPGIVLANWLTRGSINTKRNGGYAQSWQPIGREK